jgi:RNA polymerase sigma-70 factor (ECF subfamily)
MEQAPPKHDFSAVYREHFAFVFRGARRLGVPSAALDDVTQEVFVVAHRQLPSFEGRSSIKTWLYGILVRVARDHRRAKARKPVTHDNEAQDAHASRAPGPAEDMERAEAARMLGEILAGMDDKREVFVLVDLESESVVGTAAALGINENTAYARLRAARAYFNEAVERLRARDESRLRGTPAGRAGDA